MKTKVIFFALLLFLSACATTRPGVTRGVAQFSSKTATENFSQEDLDLFKKILNRRLIQLDRDMITFHYEDGNSSNFIPHSLNDLKRRITGWPEGFFNPNIKSYNVGPGEYVATDPLASRHYGVKKPQLYVITIAKGATLLDAYLPISDEETAALNKIAKHNGCQGPEDKYVRTDFADWFGAFRIDEKDVCRALVIRAAQELGVEAVIHFFGGSSTLEECRHSRRQSINIIASHAIRMNELAFFDDEVQIDANHLAGQVVRLYNESFLDPGLQQTGDINLPATLAGADVDSQSYRAWKLQNIFKCGKPWVTEDYDTLSAHEESIFSTYQDREALVAGAKLCSAFRSRFPDRTWDIERLKALQEATYKADAQAAGLSFNAWQGALNGVRYGKTPESAAAATVIGENIPDFNFRELQEKVIEGFSQKFAHSGNRLALLPSVLLSLGYGPRGERILVNHTLISYGGVPLLVGHLPRNGNENITDLVLSSKQIFINLLNDCANQYRDMHKSAAELDNSSCAILPN